MVWFLNNPEKDDEDEAKRELRKSIKLRYASLTNAEKTFLAAIFLDEPSEENGSSEGVAVSAVSRETIENVTQVLNDDSLFSVPMRGVGEQCFQTKQIDGGGNNIQSSPEKSEVENGGQGSSEEHPRRPRLNRLSRSNKSQRDLWKAHRDGVAPKRLRETFIQRKSEASEGADESKERRRSSAHSGAAARRRVTFKEGESSESLDNHKTEPAGEKIDEFILNRRISKYRLDADTGSEEESGSLDAHSDKEIGFRDDDTHSSWNSSQGGFDHYNAWEVIRDEYAEDFGFNVAVADDEKESQRSSKPVIRFVDEDSRGIFKILGTSAEDLSASPHVLSPPLMDSLLNHVPERFKYENYWLKYSLIRDGASLPTLQQYCRASTHTIIAIETTKGDVFGSFTSNPWRNNGNNYYGTGESFLWKMKNNRNTPVCSLFEQAQLESEVDIFRYNGSNDYIQLCSRDKLVLGGGSAINPQIQNGGSSTSFGGSSYLNEPIDTFGDTFAYSIAMDGNSCFDRKDFGFGLVLDEFLLRGSSSPCVTFGNPSLVTETSGSGSFDVVNLEVWTFTAAEFEQDAEQTEMSKFFIERTSTGFSNFSSNDMSSERFYRRIGE